MFITDRAFDDGSPLNTAKRDKTGIYGHSCGGLHLIQAVSAFAAASGDDAIKARVRKQLGVLLYRYDLERPACRYGWQTRRCGRKRA